jgi:glycosyltransferase involved in cell wall biosynthesis
MTMTVAHQVDDHQVDAHQVDVVITNHNLNEYLAAAVASALDQQSVRTRVIVVDDGSDEPVQATGNPWPEDRVTVVRNDPARGSAGATNVGLALVRAPFVAILDADDMWPTDRTISLLEPMLSAQADIAYGIQVIFNDGDHPVLGPGASSRARVADLVPQPLAGTCLTRSELFARTLDESLALGSFVDWLAAGRRADPPVRELPVRCVALLRRSHARNITRTRMADYGDYLKVVRNNRRQP